MFVPPDQRQPGPPPEKSPPPGRALSQRGETVVVWLVGFFLVAMLLAPIGGSTLVEALWFVLRR